MNIQVKINRAYSAKIASDQLEKIASYVLNHERPGEQFELSIVIETERYLRKLNLQYRSIDAPTDVLSFPSGDIDPENNLTYLGDVIISYPVAERQAQAAGHDINSEMGLLIIHGILHLFGYDHYEDDDKKMMWEKQALILDQLGIKISRLPEFDGDEEVH